jgi:signal transduction histidine kinase
MSAFAGGDDADNRQSVRQRLGSNPPPGEGDLSIKTSKIGLQIKASNTGTPLSPSDQNKMFAAGYTTKREHSGLGLYIIKQIAERNGGQLELREPKEYSGVEFVIHIAWKCKSCPLFL